MDNNIERWYSMKEIMEYLGVSRDTVLDWIERREMPAAKIGRLWKFGEILYTAAGKHRFQIVRLAEFDVTGAYAEQVAKIIDNMNGNFIKERFYAIPLENLPNINNHNASPRLPFYH